MNRIGSTRKSIFLINAVSLMEGGHCTAAGAFRLSFDSCRSCAYPEILALSSVREEPVSNQFTEGARVNLPRLSIFKVSQDAVSCHDNLVESLLEYLFLAIRTKREGENKSYKILCE